MRKVVLMYGMFEPSARHVDWLDERGLEVAIATDEPSAIAASADAEIIFGHRYLRQSLPRASHLRWVQTTAGGVDRLPCAELRQKSVTLTRVTFTAPAIARHAVALAWAVNRRIDFAANRQAAGEWTPAEDWPPYPKTGVIFGTGPIGCEIARRLKLEGLTVRGVKRSVSGAQLPNFDSLHPLSAATDVVREADWCFLALPEVPETRGLFDVPLIAALPRRAVLVNVGRGSAIVTSALCSALTAGHLGGAALDVIDPIPHGAEDPLWRVPRLLITPHVAAHYAERAEDMERFAEQQLDRYLAGLPLENVVDLSEHR